MTVFGFAGDISSVNSGASSDNPGTSSVNGTIGIFPKEQKGEMQFTYQRHTVQGHSHHIHDMCKPLESTKKWFRSILSGKKHFR